MAKRLSQHFGVVAEELHKRGVFNGFLGIDNKLFVDPNLLKIAKAPESAETRARLEKYFSGVIKLLSASKTQGDVDWREAAKRSSSESRAASRSDIRMPAATEAASGPNGLPSWFNARAK